MITTKSTDRIVSVLFFLFVIFEINAYWERTVPINELFSLVGFGFLMIEYRKRQDSKIIKIIMVLNIIGFAQVVYSLLFRSTAPNYYLFFRTTPVWYSSFAFYLGLKFYENIESYIVNIQRPYIKYLLLIWNFFSVERFTVFIISPLLLSTYRVWLLLLYLIALRYFKGEDTELLFVFFTILFVVFKWHSVLFNFILNKKIIICALFLFFIALIYTYENFSFFFDLDQLGAYQSLGIEKGNGLANVVWRWMFWTYLFNETIIHNISNIMMGIGFGVPIFDINFVPSFLLVDITDKEQENQPYFLGTHNSIFFVLVRQGIIVFSLLLMSFFEFFRIIKTQIQKLNYQDLMIVLSFFLILIGALFNVILESPVYGSLFWIHFGMAVAVVEKRKKCKK